MPTSTFALAQRWALDPGALQPLVQSYIDHLVSRRYQTATIHHLGHSARHFCYSLNQSDVSVAHVDDTSSISLRGINVGVLASEHPTR